MPGEGVGGTVAPEVRAVVPDLPYLLENYPITPSGVRDLSSEGILLFIGKAAEVSRPKLVQDLLRDKNAVSIISVLNKDGDYRSSTNDKLHNFLKAFLVTKEAKDFFLLNDLDGIFDGLFDRKKVASEPYTPKETEICGLLNSNGWREIFYQKLTTLAETLEGKKDHPKDSKMILCKIITLAEKMQALDWMTYENREAIITAVGDVADAASAATYTAVPAATLEIRTAAPAEVRVERARAVVAAVRAAEVPAAAVAAPAPAPAATFVGRVDAEKRAAALADGHGR